MLDLSSLDKSLKTLEEALWAGEASPTDKFIRDACIRRFEYSYDLSHKTLRRFLALSEPAPAAVAELGFAGLIRLGYVRGLIPGEWRQWRRYRDARNLTSHAYDEAKAVAILEVIGDFYREADELPRPLQVIVTPARSILTLPCAVSTI